MTGQQRDTGSGRAEPKFPWDAKGRPSVHEAAKKMLAAADRFWQNYMQFDETNGVTRVFPSSTFWKAHYSHQRLRGGSPGDAAKRYISRLASLAVPLSRTGFDAPKQTRMLAAKGNDLFNVRLDRAMAELMKEPARDEGGYFDFIIKGTEVTKKHTRRSEKAANELIRVLVESGARSASDATEFMLLIENLTMAYTMAPDRWEMQTRGDALRVNTLHDLRSRRLPDFAMVGLLNALVEGGENSRTRELNCHLHSHEIHLLRFAARALVRFADWMKEAGKDGQSLHGDFMLEDPASADEFDELVQSCITLQSWCTWCLEWNRWDFDRGKREAEARIANASPLPTVGDVSERVAASRRSMDIDRVGNGVAGPSETAAIALRENQLDGYWINRITGTIVEIEHALVTHAYMPAGDEAPADHDEEADGPYGTMDIVIFRVLRGSDHFSEPANILTYAYRSEFLTDFTAFRGNFDAILAATPAQVEAEQESAEPDEQPAAEHALEEATA